MAHSVGLTAYYHMPLLLAVNMRAASILVTLSAFVAATSAAALNKRQGPAW